MFYSCLDIRGAHNSVVLSEKASNYLNVILPNWETVQFVQAPFGLRNINSHWNSLLSVLLKDLIDRHCVTLYADDILIITRGRSAHRLVLAEIFRIFRQNNIKLSLNKCQCFTSEFKFLGFHFTKTGIKLTDERVAGILNIDPPSDIKSLQRLLGSCVYISRFIPDIQEILSPLSELLKANNIFQWSAEHDEALERLKRIVKENLKLSFIDSEKSLKLYCDSSKKCGGAVLFQEGEKDEIKPICFFSRKYNLLQTQHLSALEMEIICILDSLARLRAFVNSTSKPIQIVTDAKALIFLLKSVKEGTNQKNCSPCQPASSI